MHIQMTTGFRTFNQQFLVLEAKVEQVNINVETSLRYLVPEDQQDKVLSRIFCFIKLFDKHFTLCLGYF